MANYGHHGTEKTRSTLTNHQQAWASFALNEKLLVANWQVTRFVDGEMTRRYINPRKAICLDTMVIVDAGCCLGVQITRLAGCLTRTK